MRVKEKKRIANFFALFRKVVRESKGVVKDLISTTEPLRCAILQLWYSLLFACTNSVDSLGRYYEIP